jgi:hypothetical protein
MPFIPRFKSLGFSGIFYKQSTIKFLLNEKNLLRRIFQEDPSLNATPSSPPRRSS